jgi:hypothetical protein
LENLVTAADHNGEIEFVNYKFGYFSIIAFIIPIFRWLVVRKFRNELIKLCTLIPGVIESTSNFVEHPEVVARRIGEAVAAVGDRERVIASADCGFCFSSTRTSCRSRR